MNESRKYFILLIFGILFLPPFFIHGCSFYNCTSLPRADAGVDKIITHGDQIILIGSKSRASKDSTIIEYKWSEGSIIYCANEINCSIDMLSVGEHRILLSIIDINNKASADIVIITVNKADNQPIVCNAKKPLVKTGQSEIYTNHDDGSYQKGTLRNYSREDISGDNKFVVIDYVSKLMWQDNILNISMTWDDAKAYCQNLDWGYFTNWRLPRINEIIYLADKGRSNPALDSNVFSNWDSEDYWSSTEHNQSNRFAWYINFNFGDEYNSGKMEPHYVQCVREMNP